MTTGSFFNDSQVNLITRGLEGSDSSSILSSSSSSSDASIRSGSTNYPKSYTSPRFISKSINTFSTPPVDQNCAIVQHVQRPENRRPAPSPQTNQIGSQNQYRHRTQRGGQHRPQCLLRRRTLILLSAFSFTLSITAVTLLAVIFAHQSSPSWEDNTFPDGRYEVCIECIKLMRDPNDRDGPLMRQLITKVGNKDQPTNCCARTSGQISALVQLMMRHNKNISVQLPSTQDVYRFSPVSAHVNFKAPESPSDIHFDKAYSLKFNTEVNADRKDTTHVREVLVDNNSLIILHTGWYFVYSSVYFRPTPDKNCKDFKYQTWGNFIMRLSDNRPDKSGCLTKTAQTCCDHCETDHQSSYTGGVFSLSKGDHIYVEISGDGLVKYDERATFMGLVMLGSI